MHVSAYVTSLPSRINDAPLTSVKITWIVFSLLIRWCVPKNCLKGPSKNSLIHFYKRCVSVSMLTSFLCRSNDAPLTSSNIPYYLLGLLIRQCVSVTCTFFYTGAMMQSQRIEVISFWYVESLLVLAFFIWWLIHFRLDWVVVWYFTWMVYTPLIEMN